jgi:hypothetical protein
MLLQSCQAVARQYIPSPGRRSRLGKYDQRPAKELVPQHQNYVWMGQRPHGRPTPRTEPRREANRDSKRAVRLSPTPCHWPEGRKVLDRAMGQRYMCAVHTEKKNNELHEGKAHSTTIRRQPVCLPYGEGAPERTTFWEHWLDRLQHCIQDTVQRVICSYQKIHTQPMTHMNQAPAILGRWQTVLHVQLQIRGLVTRQTMWTTRSSTTSCSIMGKTQEVNRAVSATRLLDDNREGNQPL